MDVERDTINNICVNNILLEDENNKKIRIEKIMYGLIFLKEINFKNSQIQTTPKIDIRMI